MCGISFYWARESSPSVETLEHLLKWGEVRGTDAVGYVIVGEDNKNKLKILDKLKEPYLVRASDLAQRIHTKLRKGDVLLVNHRAAPEQEVPSTDIDSIQPIIDENNEIILIHNGSVSSFIYNELKDKYPRNSKIDSEAIIWAYLYHNKNMKKTMEYLSGGFSFLLLDMVKEKIYAVASHNPLYCGYVRGHGMFFSSMREAIFETISSIKGLFLEKNNISVWEDYYCQEIPEFSITEIDIHSGMRNECSFTPRYIHPNYDPLEINRVTPRRKESCVLVSASGGLDSTTTLALLKEAGYNVHAVHFSYGHRGQECELVSIRKICEILDIPLSIFDIEKNMKLLDQNSMLTNNQHAITTGTEKHLKTTIAWTCFRNGFFLTYMGALAESLIINKRYWEVYLTGGFLNLSESGVYSDNSERFMNSFIKFARFASIVGTKIKPLYACANLLKTEQYHLLNKLGLLDQLAPWMISCDRPKLINGIPHNCSKDGIPACGSGLLSYWACRLSGVKDNRRYYEVHDPNYKAFVPDHDSMRVKNICTEEVLKKIQIHTLNMRILQRKLGV